MSDENKQFGAENTQNAELTNEPIINSTDEQEPVEETAAEEISAEEENPKQGGWQFDGEAKTLTDAFIENNEIDIPLKPVQPPVAKPAPKPIIAPDEPKKKKSRANKDLPKFVATAIIGALVIGVLVFFGIRYYTLPNTNETMNPGNVAVTVGDTDVSIGMYNYYYTIISNQYISGGSVDTSVDYAKQKTTNAEGKEVTWAQLFVDTTLEQIQYITAYYEEAVEKGVTLTDEQKKTIDEQIESLKTSAGSAGSDGEGVSVDKYISDNYGDYCGLATIRKMLEQCYIAETYFSQKSIDIKVTPEEVQAYFDKHKEDYQQIPYASLQIAYESTDKKAADKAVKDGEKYAKQIKSVKDIKKLMPKVCKDMLSQYISMGYFENEKEAVDALCETATTKSDSALPTAAVEWLFDENVKEGTVKSFNDTENSTVFVIMKTGALTVPEEEMYSVRHILIMPESDKKDEDGESTKDVKYTDEQWKAAEKKADEVYQKYLSSDKSEFAFASLAEEYSEDVNSTSKGQGNSYGGSIVTLLGQMTDSFEKWSTDDKRKYADTEIVKSEFGYHIMFFVEKTKTYLYDCEQQVHSEKEDEFVHSFVIKKHNSGMKKTKVAEPVSGTDGADTQTEFDSEEPVIDGEDD